MKINLISQNRFYYDSKVQSQRQKKDTEIVAVPFKPVFYTPNFKSKPAIKLNSLGLKEIKSLSLKEINMIRNSGENTIKKSIIHKFCAETIKQHLNSTFGENNYIVISIGRSLSSICKYLSYIIGEDKVKQIPLTNANRFYIEDFNEKTYRTFLDDLKRDEGLSVFLEYLKSIGLTKEEVENSGKNYIILDYVYTGKSLAGATTLLKSDLVLGNKKDNIHSANINSLLELKEISKNEYFEGEDLILAVDSYLRKNAFKDISFVDTSKVLSDTINASKKELNEEQKKEFVKIFLEGENFGLQVSDNEKEIFLKKNFDIVKIPNQKIFPWEDRATQFKKDIRNQYSKLIKLIIKEESKPIKSKKYLELESDIKSICIFLNKAEKYTSNMFGYYQIKKDIDCILNSF